MSNILVIAPHADDEILGCGGTIAKHVLYGDEVHTCIVTDPYEPNWSRDYIRRRGKNINNVMKHMGIHTVHRLGLPAVKLDAVLQMNLNKMLNDVVKKSEADIVYIPHPGDLNKDHRIVFESALVATRPLGNHPSFIFTYETISETEFGIMLKPFVPNYYVDITQTLRHKMRALKFYDEEMRNHPHPRSYDNIYRLAQMRGSEIGKEMAEAFCLIRGESVL
jgi:N-acetylglucosamine malate deacetylase 1